MQRYVLQYAMRKGNLLPENLQPVMNERSRLMRALCETDGWSELFYWMSCISMCCLPFNVGAPPEESKQESKRQHELDRHCSW